MRANRPSDDQTAWLYSAHYDDAAILLDGVTGATTGMSVPKKEPKKLKKDAIVEAVFEIRFDCVESRNLPEQVIAHLGSVGPWAGDEKVRLPGAIMPDEVRTQNPLFQFLPSLEFRKADGQRLVKVGRNALSYHRLAPYPGWDAFEPELKSVVETVFTGLTEFTAKRLGLRYVNIFTAVDHGVTSLNDFDCYACVAGEKLTGPFNLNYRLDRSDMHRVQVRMASAEYTSAPPEMAIAATVDMDVFTPAEWETADKESAAAWLADAHRFEKSEFFKLFSEEMQKRLFVE